MIAFTDQEWDLADGGLHHVEIILPLPEVAIGIAHIACVIHSAYRWLCGGGSSPRSQTGRSTARPGHRTRIAAQTPSHETATCVDDEVPLQGVDVADRARGHAQRVDAVAGVPPVEGVVGIPHALIGVCGKQENQLGTFAERRNQANPSGNGRVGNGGGRLRQTTSDGGRISPEPRRARGAPLAAHREGSASQAPEHRDTEGRVGWGGG